MIRIIRKMDDQQWFRMECDECLALFEYQRADLSTKYGSGSVNCPECGDRRMHHCRQRSGKELGLQSAIACSLPEGQAS